MIPFDQFDYDRLSEIREWCYAEDVYKEVNYSTNKVILYPKTYEKAIEATLRFA